MMATNKHDHGDADGSREAKQILDRVEADSEKLGTSNMARNANRLRDHFMGEENPEDERLEVMAKRIARILAAIAFVYLFWSLYTTYFS